MEKFLADWDCDIEDPSKDKTELYQALVDKQREHRHNVEVLWRLVRACLIVSEGYEKMDDKAQVNKFTTESLEWAKKAVQYGPDSFEAHKW